MASVDPAGPSPNAEIVPDESLGDNRDAESTYSSIAESSASTSLASSVLNYKYENGRRYHSFRDGEYILPNDENEQDRLDLVHHVFRLILNGSLYRAPLAKDIQRALDVGTGTGIWAIELADEFPSAQVIGTDLSPIQPTWLPPNCSFYVDDLESEWTFGPNDKFDYVHMRCMSGCVSDWSRLFGQIQSHLKPGGWFEIQEFEMKLLSDEDPNLDRAAGMRQWQNAIEEASSAFGKAFNSERMLAEFVKNAGFINVRDDRYKVPCGPWAKDPRLKEIGRFILAASLESIEPYSLALLTRVHNWSKQECDVLIAKARNDLTKRTNHLHAQYHFVYGQKPPEAMD